MSYLALYITNLTLECFKQIFPTQSDNLSSNFRRILNVSVVLWCVWCALRNINRLPDLNDLSSNIRQQEEVNNFQNFSIVCKDPR